MLSKSVISLLYAPHIGLSIIHDFTHTERRRRRRQWASTIPAIAMKQQAVPATAMSTTSMLKMPDDWQVNKQDISYKYS